jgi:outer membrane protein OmpA-like peptidoglycan-associated protein
MVRSCAVVALIAWSATAAAEPVRYELATDVPAGRKPILRLHAAQRLTDLRVELVRGDGKHTTIRRALLAEGETAELVIGDGALGKASYDATLTATTADGAWRDALHFETSVHAALTIGYDADHLDLAANKLQFKPSRAVREASVVAIGEDGHELGRGAATYPADQPAGWYAIAWNQVADARVLQLRLRVAAADGAATTVELTPWSVTVDHQDVTFATDSAAIDPAQAAKLDDSLAKINEIVARTAKFLKPALFIAGHTDTVGPAARNRALSAARAAAIGGYLRAHGLTIPIVVAGFGEDVPRVATPDNTDEPANRRADYVLGPAAGAPPFAGAYLKARAAWKPLR